MCVQVTPRTKILSNITDSQSQTKPKWTYKARNPQRDPSNPLKPWYRQREGGCTCRTISGEARPRSDLRFPAAIEQGQLSSKSGTSISSKQRRLATVHPLQETPETRNLALARFSRWICRFCERVDCFIA